MRRRWRPDDREGRPLGRKIWDDMDEASEVTGKNAWTAVLRVLRPAVPAVIGAAALTFLFAAVMPMAWVAGIGWNLYLDRLSDLFVPPVGNGARLALALGMAIVAAALAGFIALLVANPGSSGLGSLRRRARNAADDDDYVPVRRRADIHPDDLPRAPIRAGRDLPAEGLVPGAALPSDPAPVAEAPPEYALAEHAEWHDEDELVLADLAPLDADEPGDEPWLQPVESTGPAMPDPTDNSLGAMVARFEAGLSRRQSGQAAAPAIPVPSAAPESEGEVDFALEAALSTLQRMNRQAIG